MIRPTFSLEKLIGKDIGLVPGIWHLKPIWYIIKVNGKEARTQERLCPFLSLSLFLLDRKSIVLSKQ